MVGFRLTGRAVMIMKKKLARAPKNSHAHKPYYFVSYSTGEPIVEVFVEYLELVFRDSFQLKRTPSALASGQSQHDAIIELIDSCAFGVVCLDGLRPNVVYEYGALRGAKRPLLLFREASSTVDLRHFAGDTVTQTLVAPPIDIDKHFSNSKDKYCVSWNRFQFTDTVNKIWEEYDKIKHQIAGAVQVSRPSICT
jgi:hypothetical protein